jgi:hypothetical protein
MGTQAIGAGDAATFDLGLCSVEAVPGEQVRIYTAERSVADVLQLRAIAGDCAQCCHFSAKVNGLALSALW